MAYKEWQKQPVVVAIMAFVFLTLAFLCASVVRERVPWWSWRTGYHAVFLSNGQVYFGRVSRENSRTLTLTDVYYFKFTRPVVSQDDLGQSDASLVKLGNELHGPEDWMEIARSQILFLEKLKSDGQVAHAIATFQGGKK